VPLLARVVPLAHCIRAPQDDPALRAAAPALLHIIIGSAYPAAVTILLVGLTETAATRCHLIE
jgi:hypothetical protein